MSAPPDELLSGGDENVLIRPSSLVIETPLLDASNNALIRGKWKGRLVVVKRLGIDVSEEMLQDQAGKWFKLRHPNVSRICGIADHASDPLFTVIPFYNHGNIRQYLTKKLLSNRHKLILDIALGMQYLHNNGIVHGGLRPTNIFVTNDECATISEYGMFELLHTTEDHEAHRYLSPEAWRGINSRSSDIYAFSMCALEIFTSILPWGALSEKHIAHLVMYEDARPTRPDDDEITDDLWSIIVSAWHPEPRSRPSFDLVVRLWRAGTSRVDIPAADESGSNTPTLPPMHRVQSGSSVGSDNSSGSGPPAYDRISVSAPPHIQQFAFNTTENTRSTLQPEDALYSHSRHSSISGHDSSQSSRPRTPNTAPAAVQQFSVNMDTSMFQMRPSSPSYSWYSSAISGDHQPSTSSSSVRSVYPPTIPADSSLSLHKPRIGASLQRAYGAVMTSEDDSSFYEIFQNVGQTLPSLKSRARQDDSSVYEMSQSLGRALPSVESGSRQWEIGQRMPPARHQLSFSEISISSASSGPAGATQGRSAAVLLVGSLLQELKGSCKIDVIDSYLVKIYTSASESDKEAQKLITAGAAPVLVHLLRTRAAEISGLEIVLITLGCLAHDSISANMIYRTNTAFTLIAICRASISNEISCLSIWCLSRICRSAEVAQGLIKANVVSVLLKQSAIGDMHSASLAIYCLGTLAQNDVIAEFLSAMDVISFVVSHLRQSTESPQQNPDHICAGLYTIARLSRSVKLAKSLAKAGCIDLISYHLNIAGEPNILHWGARAVGCLMRPNSNDMAKLLLEADTAKGLARLPTVLFSENLQALGSLGFAVQRFSCAEWGAKTRQSLVDAGVVDSLLAALRTAADEPCYEVHIELALAVSLLGDVGGSAIRKEIINAGGIAILKGVSSNGNAEVGKACSMAITSITGNIWSRNAASAKTAMAHNWNGGCPEYQPPCPLILRVLP